MSACLALSVSQQSPEIHAFCRHSWYMPVPASVLPSSKCHELSEDRDNALSYEFILHRGQ